MWKFLNDNQLRSVNEAIKENLKFYENLRWSSPRDASLLNLSPNTLINHASAVYFYLPLTKISLELLRFSFYHLLIALPSLSLHYPLHTCSSIKFFFSSPLSTMLTCVCASEEKGLDPQFSDALVKHSSPLFFPRLVFRAFVGWERKREREKRSLLSVSHVCAHTFTSPRACLFFSRLSSSLLAHRLSLTHSLSFHI